MSAFTTTDSGQTLVTALVAPTTGLTVSGITYVGASGQAGLYDGSLTSYGLSSGIILTTGSAALSNGNTTPGFSHVLNTGSDPDVAAAAKLVFPSATMYDANSLTFHLFVSDAQIQYISFSAVFGSDEYPEYIGQSYVDTAVVMVNGVNVALVGNNPLRPLSINTQNVGFHTSTQGEYDGVTAPLSITAAVHQGDNVIKIAIADGGDAAYDSAILISNLHVTNASGTGITIITTPPPAAPTGLTLDGSTDSAAKGDSLTNIPAVQIDGSAEAGSTVKLYDGATLIGTGAADTSTGAFHITTSALSDGAHNITATATNEGGTSGSSSVYNVAVDTHAAAAPGVALTVDSGSSNSDHVTNSGALSLTGVEQGASLSYVVDGGAASATYEPAALADGQHTVSVSQTDAAGNVSQAGSLSFTLDTTAVAPGVALTVDSGASNSDHVTNSAALSLTGVEQGASLSYVVDGGAASATYDPAALADGQHTVSVSQTDAAGNVSQAGSLSFTLDTTAAAPAVTLAVDSGVSATDHLTNTAGLSLSGVEQGAGLSYVVDGGAASASYDPAALADGQHTVSVSQTDAAGNVSQAGSLTFTLDTAAAAPGVALTVDSGASNSDHVTNSAALSLTGVEQGASLSYVVDGGAASASYNPAALADGQHTVSVSQTDAAGNVSQAGSLTFTLDTAAAAPGVALTVDSGASNSDHLTNKAGLSLSGVEQGASLSYVVDGGAASASYNPAALADGQHTVSVSQTDAAGNVSQAGSLSFTLDTAAAAPGIALTVDSGTSNSDHLTNKAGLSLSGVEQGASLSYIVDGGAASASYNPAALADGQHTVSVSQTDAAGNVSQAGSLSFTLDTAAAAPGIALTVDSGTSNSDHLTNKAGLSLSGVEQGASLSYIVDGGAASASYNPAALADGQHTVSVSQTDAAGNVSQAGSLSFRLDTTAPVALGVSLTHDTGASATDRLTSDGSLTFSGVEQGGRVEYSLDGSAWGTASVVKEGANDFFVHQVDAAGNVGASTEFKFTLDTKVTGLALTNVVDKVLIGTSEANSSVSVFDNGQLLGTVKAASDGSWSLATNAPGNVIHTYTETAVDTAGNTAASSGVGYYTPAANKALVGGAGDDVLIGRPNDVLTGGAGHDSFVFNAEFGKETVTDFTAGTDRLEFDHTVFANFAALQANIHQVGANTVISYGGGDAVTLVGVNAASLHASDFGFI